MVCAAMSWSRMAIHALPAFDLIKFLAKIIAKAVRGKTIKKKDFF